VGRKSPLSQLQLLLPPNQEVMSQDDQGHVMVPASPETQLILIHAQFPLARDFISNPDDRYMYSTHNLLEKPTHSYTKTQ
jgi:hypothetical protein